jgi:hypothetical protein
VNEHRRDWQLGLPAFVQAWRKDAKTWDRALGRSFGAEPDVDRALARLGLVRISSGAPSGRSLLPGLIPSRVRSTVGVRMALLGP